MARVFLSYARDDADCAGRLATALGGAGHEVWWDQHIQGGSRFTAAIDRALKDAEAVVVENAMLAGAKHRLGLAAA